MIGVRPEEHVYELCSDKMLNRRAVQNWATWTALENASKFCISKCLVIIYGEDDRIVLN